MTNPNFVALEACGRTDRLLVYQRQNILYREGRWAWELEELGGLPGSSCTPLLVGQRDQSRYLAVHVDSEFRTPKQAEFVPLRQVLFAEPAADFYLPGLGNQLTSWLQSHRFCGLCGRRTRPHPVERAVICPACQQSSYPRINPCAIVLVTDGERMLLARHSRYKGKFFSCLAGFVEVGETPEQTVVREVKEEANIEVGNVRYVKSQSWPFPSQLMLGFFADYQGGELRPEPGEIEELKWFSPHEVPNIPSPGVSVAGQLIELHCAKYRMTE